jgi:hypothetical protein
MNKFCNNDVYKSLFNLIYDNIGERRKDYNKIRQVQASLEKILFDKELKIEADTSSFNNSLLTIQNEIQRIIKENLKVKDDELYRNNPDVVLVERDEFIIASPRKINKPEPSRTDDIIESIQLYLKRLGDLTKPPENSSNFY